MFKTRMNILKLTMAVSLIGTAAFGMNTLAMENALPYNTYENKFAPNSEPLISYDLKFDKNGKKEVTILGIVRLAPEYRVMKTRAIDLDPYFVNKIKEGGKIADETKQRLIATFEKIILEYYSDNRKKLEYSNVGDKKEPKFVCEGYNLGSFKNLDDQFANFVGKLNKNNKDDKIIEEKPSDLLDSKKEMNKNNKDDKIIEEVLSDIFSKEKISKNNKDDKFIEEKPSDLLDSKKEMNKNNKAAKITKEGLLDFLVSKYINDVDSFVEKDKKTKKLVCKQEGSSVFDLSFINYGAVGQNQDYRIIFSPQLLAEKYKRRDKVNNDNYKICNSPESFKHLCFKIQDEENPYSCLIIGPYYDGGTDGHFMIELVKNYNSGNYINIAQDLVTFRGTDIQNCCKNLYPKDKSKRLKLEDKKEYVVTAYASGNFNCETNELELKDEVYSEKIKARGLVLNDWLEFDTLSYEKKVKHSKNFDVILWFEYYINNLKELQ